MRIKNKRYSDEANYLIHFNRDDDINISSLRLIRDLERTIVSWSHYKSKSPEVCVCHNCWNFGHGAMLCYMPPKCVICARGHVMKDCPFLKDKIERGLPNIATKHLRCTHCKGNHTATFRGCYERLKFIENRRPKQRSQNQPRAAQVPPQNQIQHTSPRILPSSSAWTPAPQRPNPPGLPNINRSKSYKEQVQPADNLSIINCQAMLDEIFKALQSCNNYFEQAKAIFDLGIKYFAKFS